MKIKTLVFVFFIANYMGFSQVLPPIQLDRPDQTECPFIVPKGFIQFESGFTYEKINANESNFSYPTVLWKYGVNNRFEWRLITELLSQRSLTEKTNGFAPLTVGFKAKLLEEENGILPIMSFIGHLSLKNTGIEALRTQHYAPSFRFTMQHSLTEKWTLAYNLGAEWDGDTAASTFLYTLTSGISLSEKWGFYAEMFGFAPQQTRAQHQADAGFTYLVNDDFMLDVSGGLGITPNAPSFYVSFGISHRFKIRK